MVYHIFYKTFLIISLLYVKSDKSIGKNHRYTKNIPTNTDQQEDSKPFFLIKTDIF